MHHRVDVHGTPAVPARPDRGELDDPLCVGDLGAAQIALVVGRCEVLGAGVRAATGVAAAGTAAAGSTATGLAARRRTGRLATPGLTAALRQRLGARIETGGVAVPDLHHGVLQRFAGLAVLHLEGDLEPL